MAEENCDTAWLQVAEWRLGSVNSWNVKTRATTLYPWPDVNVHPLKAASEPAAAAADIEGAEDEEEAGKTFDGSPKGQLILENESKSFVMSANQERKDTENWILHNSAFHLVHHLHPERFKSACCHAVCGGLHMVAFFLQLYPGLICNVAGTASALPMPKTINSSMLEAFPISRNHQKDHRVCYDTC